jgi:hypothetical protein
VDADLSRGEFRKDVPHVKPPNLVHSFENSPGDEGLGSPGYLFSRLKEKPHPPRKGGEVLPDKLCRP